ncbi:MAG: LemA family protein [Phycisphaeraceae bacterium]|nr:LemA family protein [Phycisphaerales bacterium]MCB9860632.1 LemA family protein [Phycisphaeraceae bacterium]
MVGLTLGLSTLLVGAGIGLAILVVILLYSVGVFNKLVSLRERFKNAFAQIDVQLVRRYELIPNLVETVKGYMKHEKETLEAVISARNAAMSGLQAAKANPGNPQAMQQLMSAENQLGGVLGRLFAVAEAYPDLKASANMQQLTEELTSTENKIAYARQAFNDGATIYNEYKKQFPQLIVAALTGHGEHAEYLEFEQSKIEAAQDAPKVSF